ncbi:MAG: hypothetical protein AAFN50_02250 [Pseudomonadota bacterium]
MADEPRVLRVTEIARAPIEALLHRYGLTLVVQPGDEEITGSFWGDAEAGIVGHAVYVRPDTPIHSLLHETCHVICMTEDRRNGLERDAGGDDIEESAVCFLQVVLSDWIDGVGRDRLMLDMDAWGYSFRLGTTRAWFECDADDAEDFLKNHGLLDDKCQPTFTLRR